MKDESKILQTILWSSELTPKIIKIIDSNMEYGVKFNFFSDLQRRLEDNTEPIRAFHEAVEAAKTENNEPHCSEMFWYND